MPPHYLVVAALWAGWCALHSQLIHGRLTAWLRRRRPTLFPYYRLSYNLFSGATLLPVLLYTWWARGAWIWQWQGLWRLGQGALLGAALALFYAGGRRYDMLQFAGVRQIRSGTARGGLTTSGQVDAGGILGIVRHPWYAAGILLVWARDLTTVDLAANLVITAYMVVGSCLEEGKLRAEFGTEYEAYQARVPMLMPWRWLLAAGRRWLERWTIRR